MTDLSPNIQSILPRTQEASRIRRAFIEQAKIVHVDLSEIEGRVLAYMEEKTCQ